MHLFLAGVGYYLSFTDALARLYRPAFALKCLLDQQKHQFTLNCELNITAQATRLQSYPDSPGPDLRVDHGPLVPMRSQTRHKKGSAQPMGD